MRLATANIWGLPTPLSWPPRHVRFPRVRRFIEGAASSRSLDIVALQEHWRIPGRPRVLDELGLVAPAAHEGDSGLALNTRRHVIERAHGSFRNRAALALDRMWSAKGWQRVAVDCDGRRVDVINTHLEAHAGPRNVRVRSAQIDELLDLATRVAGAVVLVGDFNVYAGIEMDQESLARIAAAGFVDAFLGECERFDRVFVRGLECTAARVDVDARLADHRPVVVDLETG